MENDVEKPSGTGALLGWRSKSATRMPSSVKWAVRIRFIWPMIVGVTCIRTRWIVSKRGVVMHTTTSSCLWCVVSHLFVFINVHCYHKFVDHISSFFNGGHVMKVSHISCIQKLHDCWCQCISSWVSNFCNSASIRCISPDSVDPNSLFNLAFRACLVRDIHICNWPTWSRAHSKSVAVVAF